RARQETGAQADLDRCLTPACWLRVRYSELLVEGCVRLKVEDIADPDLVHGSTLVANDSHALARAAHEFVQGGPGQAAADPDRAQRSGRRFRFQQDLAGGLVLEPAGALARPRMTRRRMTRRRMTRRRMRSHLGSSTLPAAGCRYRQRHNSPCGDPPA